MRVRGAWAGDQRLRFLVVGGYNTVFGVACFPVLYVLFGRTSHYLALSTVAHFIAVTNAFIAHRVVAFRAEGAWLPQWVRFCVGHLGTLGLGLLGLALLVGRLRLTPLQAQPILLAVSVILSYFWHSRVSFRDRAKGA